MADDPARARECYVRRGWREACEGFLGGRDELGADDLERLAVSAYLVGRNRESDEAWALAHRSHLHEGHVAGAVRCAFWRTLVLAETIASGLPLEAFEVRRRPRLAFVSRPDPPT